MQGFDPEFLQEFCSNTAGSGIIAAAGVIDIAIAIVPTYSSVSLGAVASDDAPEKAPRLVGLCSARRASFGDAKLCGNCLSDPYGLNTDVWHRRDFPELAGGQGTDSKECGVLPLRITEDARRLVDDNPEAQFIDAGQPEVAHRSKKWRMPDPRLFHSCTVHY